MENFQQEGVFLLAITGRSKKELSAINSVHPVPASFGFGGDTSSRLTLDPNGGRTDVFSRLRDRPRQYPILSEYIFGSIASSGGPRRPDAEGAAKFVATIQLFDNRIDFLERSVTSFSSNCSSSYLTLPRREGSLRE